MTSPNKIQALSRQALEQVIKIQERYHCDIDPDFERPTPKPSFLKEEDYLEKLNPAGGKERVFTFVDKYDKAKEPVVFGSYWYERDATTKLGVIRRLEIIEDKYYPLCIKLVEAKLLDDLSLKEIKVWANELDLQQQLALKAEGYRCNKIYKDEDSEFPETFYVFHKGISR